MKTFLASLLIAATFAHATEQRPNLLLILADDLGYGDVHCLNPQRGRIPTPNLDKLASQGMTFTDAHASAAVCSPSRYGLLTGRYNWRSRLQAGIVPLWGKPLIAGNRLTIAGMFKQQGYDTACIGKWHLGWDWPETNGEIDFSKPIANGPTTRGFDSYFGTDVPNWPPFCFIANDHTVGTPSEPLAKELLAKDKLLASQPGPALPGWKLEDILPSLTDRACRHVEQKAQAGRPFFLYFPLTAPHTPIALTAEWQGRSGIGRYADYVMETDAMVGRVLATIEQQGIADNTIVIFTSDNGCAPGIGVPEMKAKGHYPSAQFRGYKFDVWEGGHREPFFIRWPAHIKPGSRCGQMICLSDIMATCAEITGAKLPDNAAEDSVSFLPLLKGGDNPVRETLVNHSAKGEFAIRDRKWKLIVSKTPQLYDMGTDEVESQNLAAEHPEVVKKLTATLQQIIAVGRSTPGPKQQNDVPVKMVK